MSQKFQWPLPQAFQVNSKQLLQPDAVFGHRSNVIVVVNPSISDVPQKEYLTWRHFGAFPAVVFWFKHTTTKGISGLTGELGQVAEWQQMAPVNVSNRQ
jgi:hypothetical protein